MEIKQSGSQPSAKGPAEYFTGNVRIDPLFQTGEPARGWIQCWGGHKKEIRPGDVIACACGEKHWHGATATTGMSHIAIQEWLDGKPVDWLEKVTDEQYLAESRTD